MGSIGLLNRIGLLFNKIIFIKLVLNRRITCQDEEVH